ncbi:hypothetical protein [Fusobacterium varium]|uniref:hypothetical protein n=1 Tax=Fusobacterium varium TaxID=856 RepID=UPI00241CA86D|nr:hypothetical protein [Fusobacterium varium]
MANAIDSRKIVLFFMAHGKNEDNKKLNMLDTDGEKISLEIDNTWDERADENVCLNYKITVRNEQYLLKDDRVKLLSVSVLNELEISINENGYKLSSGN